MRRTFQDARLLAIFTLLLVSFATASAPDDGTAAAVVAPPSLEEGELEQQQQQSPQPEIHEQEEQQEQQEEQPLQQQQQQPSRLGVPPSSNSTGANLSNAVAQAPALSQMAEAEAEALESARLPSSAPIASSNGDSGRSSDSSSSNSDSDSGNSDSGSGSGSGTISSSTNSNNTTNNNIKNSSSGGVHPALGNVTGGLVSEKESEQQNEKEREQETAVELTEEDKELAERLGVSASDVGNLRGSVSARNESELAALAASLGSCESPERPLDAKCTGCPPMYNGKLCATTTWYEDHTKGSCGCGDAPMVSESYWTLTSFTAALNTASLDPKNPANTYCLAGCGTCYEICTTGGVVNSMDTLTPHSQCQVFKVTNRCADGWYEGMGPNWCSQQLSYDDCKADPHKCRQSGNTNMYGYAAHFDLQDAHRQIQDTLGWMNPEVTFEAVDCSLWNGPDGSTCPGCEDRPWWWR